MLWFVSEEVPVLMVRTVMHQVIAFYPQAIREQIEKELPTLALQAGQLGLEVMLAEHQGLRYAEAVVRPDFLKMGRVCWGATNLLQWRVPPEILAALKAILEFAASGGSSRRGASCSQLPPGGTTPRPPCVASCSGSRCD